MEYLVTMTTHVPEGTSEEAVQDIRPREAHRSGELAAQHLLLRLWRPPLQGGEWRTLGLPVAADGIQLESTLASMPLRMWRKDDVTPLSPHPNDPTRQTNTSRSFPTKAGSHEFLTTFVLTVTAGTPGETVNAIFGREAERARELAEWGRLQRLWTLRQPRLGFVAGERPHSDAGDPGVDAVVRVGKGRDHPAQPTSQRPRTL